MVRRGPLLWQVSSECRQPVRPLIGCALTPEGTVGVRIGNVMVLRSEAPRQGQCCSPRSFWESARLSKTCTRQHLYRLTPNCHVSCEGTSATGASRLTKRLRTHRIRVMRVAESGEKEVNP